MSARECLKASYVELMHAAMFSFENKKAVVEYAVNEVLGLDISVDKDFTMKQLSDINEFVMTL